jgi:hypothetical protein
MRISRKRLAVALIAGALTVGTAAPAFAGTCDGGGGGKVKCNAGRGNGSEPSVYNDCDPGNSGGHNNGGD